MTGIRVCGSLELFRNRYVRVRGKTSTQWRGSVPCQRIAGCGDGFAEPRRETDALECFAEVHSNRQAVIDDENALIQRPLPPASVRSANATKAGPICSKGSTRSAAPTRTASRGIPKTTEVASS